MAAPPLDLNPNLSPNRRCGRYRLHDIIENSGCMWSVSMSWWTGNRSSKMRTGNGIRRMITRIEANGYRCLKYINQPLRPFQVLVGPNASGKSTFLDVVSFLGRLVSDGLDVAIAERSSNFFDLLWGREGDAFELAIEAQIPLHKLAEIEDQTNNHVRYEVKIGLHPETKETMIIAERVILIQAHEINKELQPDLFPYTLPRPNTIATGRKGTKTVVNKVPGGNDNFYAESGKGWAPSFRLGPRKSALANLPEDETRFPVSIWFRNLIVEGVQQFVLNSQLIRRASPPAQKKGFKADGSNLPWVIDDLRKNKARFDMWIDHVRTALPEVQDVFTIERQDDKHRYLVIKYEGGFDIPSWMVSDGTLRLLALTIPAYYTEISGIYLIEEPENGIHPKAIETVIQSLSSMYESQVLLASHSPIILGEVDPAKILCFAKSEDGATSIVSGDRHPALKNWRGEISLSALFAGGVLG